MLEYKCDKMGREILLKVSGNTLKELIINAIAALEKEQDLIELLSKSGRLLLRVVLCLMPPVGMLMIPKTCAYVWVVLIGYNAMKESNRE